MTREWTPVEIEPLVDDETQRSWWQPIVRALSDWEPKVGDKVRVRLNGECQTFHMGSGHAHDSHELIAIIRSGDIGGPGYMGANGAEGEVVSFCPPDDDETDEGARQHVYYVSDATDGKWKRVDDFFAAGELEPLP